MAQSDQLNQEGPRQREASFKPPVFNIWAIFLGRRVPQKAKPSLQSIRLHRLVPFGYGSKPLGYPLHGHANNPTLQFCDVLSISKSLDMKTTTDNDPSVLVR